MGELKKVLIVTNSATDNEISEIKQALVEAAQKGIIIQLSLVHVIPTLPACYFNIPSIVLLAERYYEEAKQTLACVGNMLKIQQENQWLITGKIRTEVLRLASKLKCNFILASSKSLPDLHKNFLFPSLHNAQIKSFLNAELT